MILCRYQNERRIENEIKQAQRVYVLPAVWAFLTSLISYLLYDYYDRRN